MSLKKIPVLAWSPAIWLRCSVSVVIQRLGQSSTCKVSQSSYFISLTKIEGMSGKETFKKIEIQHFLKVFLCDIISMFYKRNITFQKPYAMNYYQDVEPLPKRWTSTKQLGPALACFMVACLDKKCWPRFCHEKKTLIFLYTTRTLDF